MSPRTKKNLITAMECDAIAAAKYSRFAARARIDSEWELARAFQDAADTDRTDHFANEAKLEGLVGSTPDNLRNAIDSEMKELKIYKEFAREANEDGDHTLAAVFEKMSSDKSKQIATFNAILENMGIHSSLQTIEC